MKSTIRAEAVATKLNRSQCHCGRQFRKLWRTFGRSLPPFLESRGPMMSTSCGSGWS